MKHCKLCGKGSKMGGKRRLQRGHYNPVSMSRKYPNLQFAQTNDGRKLICTNCLKSLHKNKK